VVQPPVAARSCDSCVPNGVRTRMGIRQQQRGRIMRPGETRLPFNGSRVAVAVASWCGASLAVLASAMFLFAALAGSGRSPWPLVAPLVAWLSLAVMTVRWIQNRSCHWLWPIVGTACGTLSAAAFFMVGFLYIAAVPLAVYLVFWHLLRPSGFPLKRRA